MAAGETVDDEAHHLLRWLDASGVVGGPWLEAAAAIQADLWELSNRQTEEVSE